MEDKEKDEQLPTWYKEKESHPKFDGPVSGLGTKRLNGMDVADLLYDAGFTDPHTLERALATLSAEALFYQFAFHHNLDADGNILSTDWGFGQVNDKAHPQYFDQGSDAFMDNLGLQAKAIREIFVSWDHTFKAWAANTSGIWLDDYHIRRSALALLNSTSRRLVLLAKARPASINGRPTPVTKTPPTLITIRQFNTIYPPGT